MSEKLDHYKPLPEVRQGVLRQLSKAGIDPDQVPIDWLEAILAATSKWIQTTDEGVAHIASLLNFDFWKGEDEKSYSLIDDESHQIREIDPDDILFVQGILAERRPVTSGQIEIDEKPKHQCDDCGIVSHCIKSIRDPSEDKLKELCNNCIMFNQSPRVNEHGDIDMCDRCSKLDCPHHPGRKTQFG